MLLLRSKVMVIVIFKAFPRALIPSIVRIIGLLNFFPSREFIIGAISNQALDAMYDLLKSIRLPSPTETPTHGPSFLPIFPKTPQSTDPNHFNR